ncbi:flavin reductase family protein [Dietzia natronolimnaea]|uniref:flavin reductase family protein n=1 Tax=Dietzia natronolimnaea TaxID=161920 RepID=UPI0015F98824|nr:flavin reductase family protein [Dietzia natronolimnaea]MBB1037685.1 flavin reductase family protein [Dietzia natronolimnaea]
MGHFDMYDFRRVMGTFPTGVVIITALDTSGEPLAMTVGSFVSVSMDPPLIGFLPAKTSSSWASLRTSGTTKFGVNVLGGPQEDICRAVASRKTDKLAGFEWTRSEHGSPVLKDAVAFIDCDTHSISDAGDHDWVMGDVLDLYTLSTDLPLLFFRGGYGSFAPGSMAINTDISVDVLHQLDLVRPHMESLAAELVTEVSVMTLNDGELINVGAVGRPRRRRSSSRVGVHVPFMPPIGGVFAAFGGPEAEALWFSKIHPNADTEVRTDFEVGLENVRRRGYACGLGHAAGEAIELQAHGAYVSKSPEERKHLEAVVSDAARTFNIVDVERDQDYEFHSATAPIFDRDGVCVFSMTAWGSDGLTSGGDVLAALERLKRTADAAAQDLKFRGR